MTGRTKTELLVALSASSKRALRCSRGDTRTGFKPAGHVDPAIEMADLALESGPQTRRSIVFALEEAEE